METKSEVKVSKSKPTTSTVNLRVKRDFRKTVLAELAQLNKKDFGRKVKADDILRFALLLLTDDHREQIKNATLSAADYIEQKFREIKKTQTGISKNEFLASLYEAKFNEKIAAKQ